jgi:hypothetical protein
MKKKGTYSIYLPKHVEDKVQNALADFRRKTGENISLSSFVCKALLAHFLNKEAREQNLPDSCV